MNKIKIIGFAAVLLFSIARNTAVLAQKSMIYVHEDVAFNTGIELFQKEKYGAAQKSFAKVLESKKDFYSLVRIDAAYYNAICAVELFNKDGELFLKQFIANHPESPKVKTAYFYLGKYNFRKKKYKYATEWFEKVDVYDLTPDELKELYFKRGYSYFLMNQYDLSKKDLYEIKDVDSKYAAPAKYYFAHIAYSNKNYETAMKDFVKLEQDQTFGAVVPYYITQLYFLQKRYDDVISYAPALLDSTSKVKRGPEIARIIGESYYHTKRYKQAIPFFLKYKEEQKHLSREDNYQLGYAYYQVKTYDLALDFFIEATNITDDSLAQNSFYHIGDCYLHIGYKQRALNSFAKASQFDFDKKMQEDALFTYGKLCYELAYNPYNETIKAFQKFIINYPSSNRVDEAYSYLVNVFTTSKRYGQALKAIESITLLSPELKHIHQKVAYYHGIELFNSSDYHNAIKLFDKARIYTFDKTITATALYWKAESYYRISEYAKAVALYRAYIEEPGAIGKSEWSEANYNIGYAYYNLKDYENSILWFRKFVTFKPMADPKKINDSYNRIGDGFFMRRKFARAVEFYSLSYDMKLMGDDYALFQRALSYGVQKKYTKKTADLIAFIDNYATSTFIQKAKYELAKTYLANNKTELALSYFKKFIKDYPNSLYVNACLSKIALIYYNTNDDKNALAYFDKLVKRDRKSTEATEAIELIKSIYTTKGNVQKMQTYLTSIGAAIPQAALDSIAYGIAKNRFLEQDCEGAVANYKKYIKEFSNGIFVIEAHFNKAQCEYALGAVDSALISYMYVISEDKSKYTEQSLYRASITLFDNENYAQSYDYFKKLELQAEQPKNNAIAKVGLMRCSYELKKHEEAISYSKKVLTINKISNELVYESHFTTAKSLMALDSIDGALAEYRSVANATNNEYGAESSYNIANILFLKKDYTNAEKTIFDFINGDANFSYWITKSLILLADNYIALNDNFQAKTTLSTIISDSDIPELIKLAEAKLDKIIADEEAARLIEKVVEPLEVRFEGDSLEQEKLFKDPAITELDEPLKVDSVNVKVDTLITIPVDTLKVNIEPNEEK